MKQYIRRAVDKVMLPYFEQLRGELAQLERASDRVAAIAVDGEVGPSVRPGTAVSNQFHLMNHELRAIELERLRGDFDRVLSVGANGSWYFEWFRQAVGDIVEHIGIEAYLPQPDDLPDYVTWVANTADRMVDVATGSVDLVFAGQTTEHLWAHELVGFLIEAHRVLRPGGMLSLDSPNRAVTQHMLWSHGEHTVELDKQEMSQLLGLAGFRVRDVAGIWRCVLDGRMLDLEEGLSDPAILTRRVATGRDRPEDCFVWWINAERADRPVDEAGLAAAVGELFDRHWNVRVSRGFFVDVGIDLDVPAGSSGTVAETLPFPLHAGDWDAAIDLSSGTWDDAESARLTITAPGGDVIHQFELDDARCHGTTALWQFKQPYLSFALTLGFELRASADITIRFPLRLEAQ